MYVRFMIAMKRFFPRLNLNYLGAPTIAYRRGEKLFRDEP